MSTENSHDTWQTRFRKKVKKIDLLATDAGSIIWRPQPSRQFVLTAAYLKVRNTAGTFTDAPDISITNGTTATVVTTAAITAKVEGEVQRLPVTANVAFDYEHPLTLVISDAPAGGTQIDVDLILFADKISE